MKKILLLFCLTSVLTILTKAQTEEKKIDWYENLLTSNVKYEDFACAENYQDTVKKYFATHPINEKLPICHNDCPIVNCRPVVPYPQIAKNLGIGGIVSVHLLTNEEGNTIYARVLRGHPLLRKDVRTAACRTQFRSYLKINQQGVMHFDLKADMEDIEIPKLANIVRAF